MKYPSRRMIVLSFLMGVFTSLATIIGYMVVTKRWESKKNQEKNEIPKEIKEETWNKLKDYLEKKELVELKGSKEKNWIGIAHKLLQEIERLKVAEKKNKEDKSVTPIHEKKRKSPPLPEKKQEQQQPPSLPEKNKEQRAENEKKQEQQEIERKKPPLPPKKRDSLKAPLTPESYSKSSEESSEVEEDIVSEENIIGEQYTPPTIVTIEDREKIGKKEYKKLKIIQELLDTEYGYVTGLKRCLERYIDPIVEKKLMNETFVMGIKTKLSTILSVNEMLLGKLEMTIKKKGSKTNVNDIGRVFDKGTCHSLKLYIPYIQEYKQIGRTVTEQTKQNRKLGDFVHEQQEKIQKEGITLSALHSHLITPVQRIPRYRLLLQDLQKTHENEQLKQAVTEIGKIAAYCDFKNDEYYKSSMMLDLAKQLKFQALLNKPSRKLIMSYNHPGTYSKFAPLLRYKKGKSTSQLRIYLFNDILMIIEPSKKRRSIFGARNSEEYTLMKPPKGIIVFYLQSVTPSIIKVGKSKVLSFTKEAAKQLMDEEINPKELYVTSEDEKTLEQVLNKVSEEVETYATSPSISLT